MKAKSFNVPEQAVIPGPAERDLRHPRPLIGDVRRGDADVGQNFAHCIRKHRGQLLAFANWNHDRESGPLADEQRVLTTTELENVAIRVTEPRCGLDGAQVVGLFQADQQFLCAPEYDGRCCLQWATSPPCNTPAPVLNASPFLRTIPQRRILA
jgi:hypothetical protein